MTILMLFCPFLNLWQSLDCLYIAKYLENGLCRAMYLSTASAIIIMMEQELELLKKQKHEDEQGAAEEAEEKEIDAALGMMFNAV